MRLEDGPLLPGEGWFIDDLDPLPHIAEGIAAFTERRPPRYRGR